MGDFPLVDVGFYVRISVCTALYPAYHQVFTYLLHLLAVTARGGSHCKEQGVFCLPAVFFRDEYVCIIPDCPVAFIDDQERYIGETIPAGEAVIFDNLRCCKDTACFLPLLYTLFVGCFTREHGEYARILLLSFRNTEIFREKAVMLFNKRFCWCHHQHLATGI